ncbi:unnamed protein product [Arabidopsis thaliana]|uniref:Uncharacterized protein n=1 Tax=Arabidopsis thaliana TaxID=3702 RepID=Q9LH18_ARATH|nr:unnamed protein product [Arabidopsis thaliana]
MLLNSNLVLLQPGPKSMSHESSCKASIQTELVSQPTTQTHHYLLQIKLSWKHTQKSGTNRYKCDPTVEYVASSIMMNSTKFHPDRTSLQAPNVVVNKPSRTVIYDFWV